jgi:hypothetical protein
MLTGIKTKRAENLIKKKKKKLKHETNIKGRKTKG